MECRDLVAFGTSAVNRFLDGSFGRTPTDKTDGGVRVAVAFGLRQFFGGCLQFAITFFRHRRVVFRFIVGMAVFVMLKASRDIGKSAEAGGTCSRNATGSVGVTGETMRNF